MTAGSRMAAGERRAIDPWAAAAWGALAVLTGVLLFSSWQGPDIYAHLAQGREIAATGRPNPAGSLLGTQPTWLNYYWLLQLGLWRAASPGGTGAIAAIFALIWLGTLALWARTARLTARPAIGVLLAAGTVLVLTNRFEPRPEVVSYLLLAVAVLAATRLEAGHRIGWVGLAAVLGLQALWANLHAYFVFGPALALLLVLTRLLRGDPRERLAEAGKILAATVAGSMLTPYGPRLLPFVFQLASFQREMRPSIAEFRPPTGEVLRLWTVQLFWAYWAATAVNVAWIALRRRAGAAFPALCATLALALAAASSRNIPLLFILGAPSWGLTLGEMAKRGPAPLARPGWTRGLLALSAALFLGLAAWTLEGGFYRALGSSARFGPGPRPYAAPSRFSAWLHEHPMPGARIFNGSTEGAYLEFAHPGIRCYTDPRYVEVAFTREYFAALRDPAAFRAIDQRIGFDAAILGLNESAPLVAALLASPEWRLAYADPHRAFLVRRGTEAEGAILGSGDRSGRPHLRFYAGDDLSEPVNGRPAIEWVVLLVRTKQRALLREALGQLANAPRVPSVVVQYGLGFGMQERDRESVELSLAMAPNMIARSTEDRAIVDRLLRQARQAIPVPPSGEASD